ncbi:BNI4 Protein BNI4 [Candida maltosa Xu316]
MADSTYDEFFNNEFYSEPSSVTANSKENHMRNVRNSIQIKHSLSSKSLKDFISTTNNNNNNTTTTGLVGDAKKAKRTSAIKASPSLKALESILNEKNKQYNLSHGNNSANAIVEEEEEEEEENNGFGKLSPPVVFNYNKDTSQSVQTFETATESLNEIKEAKEEEEEEEDNDDESTIANSNNIAYNNNSIFSNNQLSKKTSKSSSTNSHRYNKSSISTIDESGYSTDDTPILNQPLTFQSFTPHSNDSPQLKMVGINESEEIEHEHHHQEDQQMPQKNSTSLHQPPKHIKLPNHQNSSSSSINQQQQQQQQQQQLPPFNSNNPFNSSSNSISNSRTTILSSNKNVPAPLLQPTYPATSTSTGKGDQIYRTSSNISVESNNSSLNNHNNNSGMSPPTRPKIVRKSKSMLSVISNNESSESFPKPTSPLPQTPKEASHFKNSINATPNNNNNNNAIKKSPHSAYPTFNTKPSSFSSPVTNESRPLNHKRSSTMNDLSNLKRSDYQQPEIKPPPQQQKSGTYQPSIQTNNSKSSEGKKKFSFKSLFKSKSKNHSLNTDTNASDPVKITSKSYSTPNMQSLYNTAPQPLNKTEDVRPPVKSTSSFMNRFKKTKSSENLAKFNNPQQQQQQQAPPPPPKQQTNIKNQEISVASPQNFAASIPTPPSSSMTYRSNNESSAAHDARSQVSTKAPSLAKPGSINFIREISDESVYAGKHNDEVDDDEHSQEGKSKDTPVQKQQQQDGENFDQLSYTKSIQDEDDYDYYDAKNLIENPPQKLNTGNNKYGEEIGLLPPLIDSTQFGSPFKVNYQSSPNDSPHQTFGPDESPIQRNKAGDNDELTPAMTASPSLPIMKTPQSTNSKRFSASDINGSAKNAQLLGEALFPKSLNAQEVESIVSLERSRSMKSVKSNKRNSFVNYNGSDDNIVHYNGPTSNPPKSSANNGNGITRSNSILKNSTSRRSNLNEELVMNSIDANMSDFSTTVENITTDNILGPNQSLVNVSMVDDDLMEFSEFIDVDNINFADSPTPGTPIHRATFPNQPPPPGRIDFDAVMARGQQHEQQQQQQREQSPVVAPPPPPVVIVDKSETPELKPTDANVPPPSLDSRTPSSSPISSMEQIESPKTSVEEEHDNKHHPEVIDLTKDESTPESEDASDAATEIIKRSPILETAYRATQQQQRSPQERENKPTAARPISMSFKGLNAPSFSGKLKKHGSLRSSSSHQSFNINFNDDSSSSVGGGFGTSSEDEDYDSQEFTDSHDEDDEGFYHRVPPSNQAASTGTTPRKMSPLIPPSSTYSPSPPSVHNSPNANPNQSSPVSNKSSVFSPRQQQQYQQQQQQQQLTPKPPKKFSHNKIPSISDQSSINSGSPRSFTSMISKKWGNSGNKKSSSASSPKVRYPPQQIMTNGVRFSSRIILYDTYNEDEYDRHPDTATCNQLTPMLAQQIKEELNSFKSQMDIHVESRCYTHFF